MGMDALADSRVPKQRTHDVCQVLFTLSALSPPPPVFCVFPQIISPSANSVWFQIWNIGELPARKTLVGSRALKTVEFSSSGS